MRGIDSSMQAHDGALDVQIVAIGRASSGLSSAPARTKTTCGRGSASLNKCVPQVGQKRRRMTAPLSATLRNSRVSPDTTSALVRNAVLTAPPPAPKYWHTRHQQTLVAIGSAAISKRTPPHKQPPVTSMRRPFQRNRLRSRLNPIGPGLVAPSIEFQAFGRLLQPIAGSFDRSASVNSTWRRVAFPGDAISDSRQISLRIARSRRRSREKSFSIGLSPAHPKPSMLSVRSCSSARPASPGARGDVPASSPPFGRFEIRPPGQRGRSRRAGGRPSRDPLCRFVRRNRIGGVRAAR
jgi:hypothetical protein